MNIVKPQTVEVVPYPRIQVEHLIDQLIKLQKAYESPDRISSKQELIVAMKLINKALEGALVYRLKVNG